MKYVKPIHCIPNTLSIKDGFHVYNDPAQMQRVMNSEKFNLREMSPNSGHSQTFLPKGLFGGRCCCCSMTTRQKWQGSQGRNRMKVR